METAEKKTDEKHTCIQSQVQGKRQHIFLIDPFSQSVEIFFLSGFKNFEANEQLKETERKSIPYKLLKSLFLKQT